MRAFLVAAIAAAIISSPLPGHTAEPLRLVQTIPLPDANGRLDHLAIDLTGQRLFVCALAHNSVEVIDLRKGERIHRIVTLGSPQDAAYIPGADRLVVTNDRNGACQIFDGKSYALVGSVDLKDDADNARYDSATKQVFIGYGSGAICAIDPLTLRRSSIVELGTHPEAFVLESQGPRIFVNLPGARCVAVIDRAKAKVVAKWTADSASANFPMAFDAANHRLFVGCRVPAKLMILNSDTGAVVQTVAIPRDPDDIFYDEKRRRLFVICGAGSIAVLDQVEANQYRVNSSVSTAPGARTGLFVPQLNELFIAVPQHDALQAQIRRYSLN